MPLADWEIARMVEGERMIEPFEDRQVAFGGVSHGLSSYGYDLRNGGDWRVQRAPWGIAQSGMGLAGNGLAQRGYRAEWEEVHGELLLGPGDFALCASVEYIRVPRDVVVVILGKSSWAREGVHVLATPLEPGWEGYVTLEVKNLGWRTQSIAPQCGICQAMFYQGDSAPDVSYGDRQGRYQRQGPGPVYRIGAE